MPQEILNVSVFQLDLVWEDPQANRSKIDEWLKKINGKTDVVFLPEMFTTGFSMSATVHAETMDGETIGWMKQKSAEHQVALCGSLMIADQGQYLNRLVFVEPSGVVHTYDKRHLFTIGHEQQRYTKGTARIVFEYKGWRICPLICYDLRFPVWARNRNDYDLLLYVANWPQSRADVWKTLLRARAIENQAFVAGVNRIGVDGNLVAYSGNSQLIGPRGNVISEITDHHKGIVTAGFSYSELQKFRTDFPVLNDADSFVIQ